MAETDNAVPIGTLVGMPVLSISSGNKLGRVADIRVDPTNGRLFGLALDGEQVMELPYERIYSIGRDAVMAAADDSVMLVREGAPSRRAKDVIGAKVVLESGELLGEIADVLVTLKPPPTVIYEVRRSMLDRLLGRTFFIPGSVGYALSDDAARLVVPDLTAEIASTDISALIGPSVDVKSFPTFEKEAVWQDYPNETAIPFEDEDATVLRRRDDNDETLLIRSDEDETVLRRPINKG